MICLVPALEVQFLVEDQTDMRFPDPFDDEGLILDFEDPVTRWLTLVLLLLAWLLICPMAGAQIKIENNDPKPPQQTLINFVTDGPVIVQHCFYSHEKGNLLPDPGCTPGAINPEIVADPSGDHRLVNGVEVNICAKGFNTKPFRKTTESMKRKVCAEYGSKDCPDPKKGEIDHLVPLELGGEDAVTNLWWQPAPEYHVKDWQVEDKLKPLVCHRKMTLKQAQDCIRTDWVTCAKRIAALK